MSLVGIPLLVSLPSRCEDLRSIRERGHLIVAVKDNLRPLGFRSSEGLLQGFEIDIARQLAKELLGNQNAVVLKPTPNERRLALVIQGEVDIAIARVTATPLRSRLVGFSIPYYLDSTALVTKDQSIRTLTDLSRQTIAVLENSSTIRTLKYRLPQAKLVSVKSYEAARMSLEQGEAIAFAADASVLTGWVQEFPEYQLLTPYLSIEPLCIVIPKGVQYTELRQRINEIVERWQTDGWLKERAKAWGLPWESP